MLKTFVVLVRIHTPPSGVAPIYLRLLCGSILTTHGNQGQAYRGRDLDMLAPKRITYANIEYDFLFYYELGFLLVHDLDVRQEYRRPTIGYSI